MPNDTLSHLTQLEEQLRQTLLQSLDHDHWEGQLSSSALSTATALLTYLLYNSPEDQDPIQKAAHWLQLHQNTDGGWGDTPTSPSNLSTTLLCWAALHRHNPHLPKLSLTLEYLHHQLKTSPSPTSINQALLNQYGKDQTFSVPILIFIAASGVVGSGLWQKLPLLPYYIAALPQSLFKRIGIPVVSYALPALIAIGYACWFHQLPSWQRPWLLLKYPLQKFIWPIVSQLLSKLHPPSGGYLEAVPLTSFVLIALHQTHQAHHPIIPTSLQFLRRLQRQDGSLPIDTHLATWLTTTALKSLTPHLSAPQLHSITQWILNQQYHHPHPYTLAPPGGFAWTPHSGGVPDADDTASAIIALLNRTHPPTQDIIKSITSAVTFLLQLQNTDGGIPTFCRGRGTLPFDQSTPEITAHTLWAWSLAQPYLPKPLNKKIQIATLNAIHYLQTTLHQYQWIPLWFGHQHTPHQTNPILGTSMVCTYLQHALPNFPNSIQDQVHQLIHPALQFIQNQQQPNYLWGPTPTSPTSLEETAWALHALALSPTHLQKINLTSTLQSLQHHIDLKPTPTPIGLYFAKLWYHEPLYAPLWLHQTLQHLINTFQTPSKQTRTGESPFRPMIPPRE
jgi:squalene-hopene/tetraprenyl-beta-curcumene cyclase